MEITHTNCDAISFQDLTFRFKEPTPDLRINEQKDILRKAIRKWDEASTLNIHEADPTVSDDNVDILIRFVNGSHGDPYRFDGPGGTLAHAFYPHNNKGWYIAYNFKADKKK